MAKTNETSEKKGFVASLVEFFKDVSDEAKAKKIQRKSTSLIKMAVSSKENDIIRAEEDIISAKESLEKAIFNEGKTEFDDDSYVESIINAKNTLTEAEESLEAEKKTLEYLNELLKTVKE